MLLKNTNILILNNQGLEKSGGGVTIANVLIEYFSVNNRLTFLSEGTTDTSYFQENLRQIKIRLPQYENMTGIWRFAPVLRTQFLKRRLREPLIGYDIVIVLDCKYFPAVQKYCRNSLKIYLSLSAIPVIAVRDMNGSLSQKLLMFLQYVFLERYAFQKSNIAFVSSKKHLSEVQKYEFISKKPFIVYPFINTNVREKEQHSLKQVKKEIGIEGKTVILTVTRIIPLKNLDYLIELAESIKRDDLVFLIIGDGEYKTRLEDLITQKHLQHKIILYGNREHPGIFYTLADMYIHPSYYESFSCAIYEAMLSGLPVIFPKNVKPYVSAFEELVREKEACCVDFNNRKVVIDTILKLIEDKPFRAAIGENARKRAESFEQTYPSYAQHIEAIIQESEYFQRIQ